MSNEVTVRDAGPNDIPLIRQLAEDTWWPTYSPILDGEQIRFMLDSMYSVEVLSRAMADGSQHFLLLADERGGQAFAAFGPSVEDSRVCRLHRLYVHPRSQGRGYGKRLVAEVNVRLRASGRECDRLELNVNRHNPAKAFYEKLGFAIVSEEEVAFGPYRVNDYVMQLPL